MTARWGSGVRPRTQVPRFPLGSGVRTSGNSAPTDYGFFSDSPPSFQLDPPDQREDRIEDRPRVVTLGGVTWLPGLSLPLTSSAIALPGASQILSLVGKRSRGSSRGCRSAHEVTMHRGRPFLPLPPLSPSYQCPNRSVQHGTLRFLASHLQNLLWHFPDTPPCPFLL